MHFNLWVRKENISKFKELEKPGDIINSLLADKFVDRKVDSIHIGNLESGIIITWDDKTMTNFPITNNCLNERQKQANDLAEFWKKEGRIPNELPQAEGTTKVVRDMTKHDQSQENKQVNQAELRRLQLAQANSLKAKSAQTRKGNKETK